MSRNPGGTPGFVHQAELGLAVRATMVRQRYRTILLDLAPTNATVPKSEPAQSELSTALG
jgi:hypothetical protein